MKTISGQVEETKRLEPPPRIRFGASSALLEYAVRPFPHLYKSGNGLISPKPRPRASVKS